MNEKSQKTNEDSERRRYFRIDDSLVLKVRKLDSDRFEEELDRFEEKRQAICHMNSVEAEQESLLPHKRMLEDNYPEVAEYLAFLEKRIDQLSQAVLVSHDREFRPTQKVNISAQGIRFHSKEHFEKDEVLELHLTLKPSQKHVLIIGKAVWCIDDPNVTDKNKFSVAVDFRYITSADQEILVKHIHQKQMVGLSSKQKE
jgi:hypothetical protein